MKKLDVFTFESYLVGKKQHTIPNKLIDKLYAFSAHAYHLADEHEFVNLIVQPHQPGELTVLYGIDEQIAGFSRTVNQKVDWENRHINAYVTQLYLSPLYKTFPTVESMGLTQGIKEKLGHPDEELVYVAFTNSPTTYDFVYQFSDFIYPKPAEKVPDQIISVITALKVQNGWGSANNNHPMVVNSPLVPIRGLTPHIPEESTEISEFFLNTNPDYMQGNAVLTYIPLHLAHINYGIVDHTDVRYYNPKPPMQAFQRLTEQQF